MAVKLERILINNRRKCIDFASLFIDLPWVFFLIKTKKEGKMSKAREIRPAGIHDCTRRGEESLKYP